jgi:hypothetical protein
MQPLNVSSSGTTTSAQKREKGLFMRSHPYETIRLEDMSSLMYTVYKEIAAIAKAVSEVAKTGICSLNPDVFSEEDFISGEVVTTATATM